MKMFRRSRKTHRLHKFSCMNIIFWSCAAKYLFGKDKLLLRKPFSISPEWFLERDRAKLVKTPISVLREQAFLPSEVFTQSVTIRENLLILT